MFNRRSNEAFQSFHHFILLILMFFFINSKNALALYQNDSLHEQTNTHTQKKFPDFRSEKLKGEWKNCLKSKPSPRTTWLSIRKTIFKLDIETNWGASNKNFNEQFSCQSLLPLSRWFSTWNYETHWYWFISWILSNQTTYPIRPISLKVFVSW